VRLAALHDRSISSIASVGFFCESRELFSAQVLCPYTLAARALWRPSRRSRLSSPRGRWDRRFFRSSFRPPFILHSGRQGLEEESGRSPHM